MSADIGYRKVGDVHFAVLLLFMSAQSRSSAFSRTNTARLTAGLYWMYDRRRGTLFNSSPCGLSICPRTLLNERTFRENANETPNGFVFIRFVHRDAVRILTRSPRLHAPGGPGQTSYANNNDDDNIPTILCQRRATSLLKNVAWRIRGIIISRRETFSSFPTKRSKIINENRKGCVFFTPPKKTIGYSRTIILQ